MHSFLLAITGQWTFASSSWGEFFTSKINYHEYEEVVIIGCQVRTIRSLHKILRNKLPELLPGHYRSVWSGVVLVKHNSSLIGQSWPFLSECFLQRVQLLTVQVRTKSLREVLNRRFPSNLTKHITKPSWPSILAWPPTTTVIAWRYHISSIFLRFI